VILVDMKTSLGQDKPIECAVNLCGRTVESSYSFSAQLRQTSQALEEAGHMKTKDYEQHATDASNPNGVIIQQAAQHRRWYAEQQDKDQRESCHKQQGMSEYLNSHTNHSSQSD
jgi:hypothetical protein